MKMPEEIDGFIKDLPEAQVTMCFLEGIECPACAKPVTSSSAYVYCHECGVYWNYPRIEEAKNA